jgi:hypothetical protein
VLFHLVLLLNASALNFASDEVARTASIDGLYTLDILRAAADIVG